MALRCLLVSLVASLGFELPSNQDVTSWTVSGRNWVSACSVDLSPLQAEASGWLGSNDPTMKPKTEEIAATEAAPAVLAEAKTEQSASPADLAFDSIGEGMALEFGSDLEATRAEVATVAPSIEAAPEMVATVSEPTQPEDELLTLAFPAPSASLTDEETTDQDETTSARADRLSSAVRLTREAVQAWASVIQTVGDDVIPTR